MRIGDSESTHGVGLAAGATAIPTLGNGEKPRFVLVVATAAGLIAFGSGAGMAAAAAGNSAGVAADDPMIFDVAGFTHFRSTATGQITALENEGGVAAP